MGKLLLGVIYYVPSLSSTLTISSVFSFTTFSKLNYVSTYNVYVQINLLVYKSVRKYNEGDFLDSVLFTGVLVDDPCR